MKAFIISARKFYMVVENVYVNAQNRSKIVHIYSHLILAAILNIIIFVTKESCIIM